MIIIAIILLIAAVICFFIARGQKGRLSEMNAADTYTAQLLKDIHTKVTGSLGADALAQRCEIEGIIECDDPLRAPLSGTACVAFTYTIEREYEEDVTRTDDKGKRTTTTEKRSDTMQSDDRRVSFWVRDTTGRSLVCPDGAELDLAQTGDRYDPASGGKSGRTRTLGHRHTEHSLAVGTRVYILGCAVDHGGEPMMCSGPQDKKGTFLVSRRSERELAQSAANTAKGLYIAAGGSGVLGLLLLLVGLVS